MKKKQKIVISFDGKSGTITFNTGPSLVELARCRLLFDEILYHNFSEEHIQAALDSVRKSTQNIEEVWND